MADETPGKEKTPLSAYLRRAALFLLFTLVLLIPKTLALRRRRWLWNALRLALALVGAFLLSAVRGDPTARVGPAIGLALLLLALLLRPAKTRKTVDEQARELGALVVANGGWFRRTNGKRTRVRLFVGLERVHVLDFQHRPLLEIPLRRVSGLRVEEAEGGWRLRVEWAQETAEFLYEGFFAEHLARVAETTLRSQLQQELPVLR